MNSCSRGPSFLCIGAQKSGTTWLYDKLSLHPDISFPGGKEVHFWNQFHHQGIRWYCELFNIKGITGDITPAYSILPEKKVKEIRDFNPGVPIIFLIRNPVDRAWSLARMNIANMQAALSPLGEGGRLYEYDLADGWFYRNFSIPGAVRRGLYSQTLKLWWRHFDHSQFLIIRFEELVSNPKEVLNKVAQHIGANPEPFADITDEELRKPVFKGADLYFKTEYRRFLYDLFKSDMMELEKITGMDLSDWLKPPE